MRGTRWLEDLAQDIRYGTRVFRRHPSFTITAVLSLALGIGANTAIFTLVDAAMLKPLPVQEPGRLVELLTNSSMRARATAQTPFPTKRSCTSDRTRRPLTSSRAIETDFFVAVGNTPPEHSVGQYVTGDFFHDAGRPRRSGRTIDPSDDRRRRGIDCRAELSILAAAFRQRPIGDRPDAETR